MNARTIPIATAIAATMCVAARADTTPPPFADVPELADLTERWAQAAEAFHVPGYAVAVVKDGEVMAMEGFGQRDVEADKPVTPDTMFYIASCTKTYTAMGVATLVEDGRVDLDAPVKTYLPRFALADEDATSNVTVRDLLCHRPGIDSGAIVFLDAYTGQITEDRYYHWLGQVEPTGEVRYTNVHFTLAGMIIEAVTGKTWKDYLDERIFTPAGMSRTTAYASALYGDRNAAFPLEGASPDWERCSVRKSDRVMHAAGGMGTSAADGAQWLRLCMSGGAVDGTRVLSTAMSSEMLQSQSLRAEPEGRIRRIEGYGLAWFRGTYRGHGPYFQHGGGYIGTAAHLSFLPEQGLGVVVLANSSPGGQAMCDIASIDVYDRLLGETGHDDLLPMYMNRAKQIFARLGEEHGAGDPVSPETLSAAPAAYVGTFSNRDWGDVSITVSEDGLEGSIGDLPLHLTTRGKDEFHASTPSRDEYDGVFVFRQAGVVSGVTITSDGGPPIEFTRAARP
jgi:CubicO group peptidase (beta-lactamase class C family)